MVNQTQIIIGVCAVIIIIVAIVSILYFTGGKDTAPVETAAPVETTVPVPTTAPPLVWDVIAAPNQITDKWEELKNKCEAKGKRLCRRNELCTGSDNKTPDSVLQSFFKNSSGGMDDNWFAVNDLTNEWATYGNTVSPDRLCKTHTEVAGGLPAWGLTNDKNGFYKSAKCC